MKPSKIDTNAYNTTDLVLSVMARLADRLNLRVEDDEICDKLYQICCDLETWSEDDGFGSSDMYGYIQQAQLLVD